jgi:hypothetical protein
MVPVVRKRPWYLTVALLGALAIGTVGALQGWQTFVNYRAPIDPSEMGAGIADEADRVAVVSRFQTFLQVLDVAKPRVWPLGVAALLLGTAIFVFAMRVFSRNAAARGMLVQLIVVQACANAAGYWLLRDVVDAELELKEAEIVAALPHDQGDRADAVRAARLQRAAYPLGLALDTLCSALIVTALTRRRSREYLDAPAEVLRER